MFKWFFNLFRKKEPDVTASEMLKELKTDSALTADNAPLRIQKKKELKRRLDKDWSLMIPANRGTKERKNLLDSYTPANRDPSFYRHEPESLLDEIVSEAIVESIVESICEEDDDDE